MKLTNKEYLVDITLKNLEVKQTKQPSKISCEVHYGDNYLKMKILPTLKNGIANFVEQRIRIPYASDIALVFKMLKSDKKQVFLGHYPLELENFLKQNTFFIQVKGQNLEQTNAKVYFDCRIIDKAIFDSDSDQIADDQIASPQRKTTGHSIQQHKFSRKPVMSTKHYSEVDRNDKAYAFMKKVQEYNVLLNDEFGTQLQNMKEILSKKQTFVDRFSLLKKYEIDQDKFLRSAKVQELQNRLLKLREEERVGSFLIYSLIAGVAFVLGFMAA